MQLPLEKDREHRSARIGSVEHPAGECAQRTARGDPVGRIPPGRREHLEQIGATAQEDQAHRSLRGPTHLCRKPRKQAEMIVVDAKTPRTVRDRPERPRHVRNLAGGMNRVGLRSSQEDSHRDTRCSEGHDGSDQSRPRDLFGLVIVS